MGIKSGNVEVTKSGQELHLSVSIGVPILFKSRLATAMLSAVNLALASMHLYSCQSQNYVMCIDVLSAALFSLL